jgi:pantetheine-phosphate adenylyltransferase
MRFKVVGVGGTFDEFHKGHRALLSKAFEVSERVIIGLTTDDFVKKMKQPHKIAAYNIRLDELKSYLKKQNWIDRVKIIPIKTSYGNALTRKRMEGIVVSLETAPIANEINDKREANALKPLSIIVIDMIPAYNCKPISTTRIRFMEIDREGHRLKHGHEA